MTELFDSHVHLQARDFDADRCAVIARARAAGVGEMVIIGEDEGSSRAAIELAATDPCLWATVGLHPHDAISTAVVSDFAERLAVLARRPEVVAIGEIGLDFHYDRSPRDLQIAVFQKQLAVAAALDLPVSIHSRAAEAQTLAIVQPWAGSRRAAGANGPLGVMHCFGYGVDAARRLIDLGFVISVPGTVTFPKADTIQSVVRACPDDALLIETDAPVLAPQGHRGRRNEPSYLVETAERVARLRGVTLQTLAAITTANARRLFRLTAPYPVRACVESVRA